MQLISLSQHHQTAKGPERGREIESHDPGSNLVISFFFFFFLSSSHVFCFSCCLVAYKIGFLLDSCCCCFFVMFMLSMLLAEPSTIHGFQVQSARDIAEPSGLTQGLDGTERVGTCAVSLHILGSENGSRLQIKSLTIHAFSAGMKAKCWCT